MKCLTISSQSFQRKFHHAQTTPRNCPCLLTSDAGVGRLEVGHQFLGARMIGVQSGVWDRQLAGAPARAAPVEMGQHVGRAADTAVVLAHAPTKPHPAVPR